MTQQGILRLTLVSICVPVLLGSGAGAEAPALRFEGNRFCRNGQPVLLRGTWDLPKGGPQCLKHYHLNTTMLGRRRALSFTGQGKVTCQDMKFDSASRDIVAQRIAVSHGDVIAFEIWLSIPETLADTERGVCLRIKAADDNGKKTPIGIRPEVSRKDGTEGEWVKIRWVGRVTSPATRFIEPRVAFCGRGRAYVDDIAVVLYRAGHSPREP